MPVAGYLFRIRNPVKPLTQKMVYSHTLGFVFNQIERDINRVKKLQSNMLANAIVDQRAKQELDDAMTEIKKRANIVR